MQLARVIGDVVATRKEPAFEGVKLLVIQPLLADGQDAGRPIVAVDSVGAGVGERVFFVRGKEASFPFYPTEVPADAGIVGIVDHWSTLDHDVGPRWEERPKGEMEGGTLVPPNRKEVLPHTDSR